MYIKILLVLMLHIKNYSFRGFILNHGFSVFHKYLTNDILFESP